MTLHDMRVTRVTPPSSRVGASAPPSPAEVASTTSPEQALRAVMDSLAIHLQPIVEIASGDIVGYEALVRGPSGSAFASPLALFDAAREAGMLRELDRRCVTLALRTARLQGLPGWHALFINVEPISLRDIAVDPEVTAYARDGMLVVECVERALADHPAEVLRAAAALRRMGVRVALDDVGIHEDSITLMPFLRPEVVKLDRSLSVASATLAQARDIGAILAEAERTGAVILAEGIETSDDERRAIALGATLGQGWYYGRPGPSAARAARPSELPSAGRPADAAASPVDVAFPVRDPRVATKQDLLAFSTHLEMWAAASDERPIVVATFQTAERFTPATRRRYAKLAMQCSLVGALAIGIGDQPALGVRGADLDSGDDVANQWNVIVVGRHMAGALVARDLGDMDRPDGERRFQFVITYDRALVVEAARSILVRLAPITR